MRGIFIDFGFVYLNLKSDSPTCATVTAEENASSLSYRGADKSLARPGRKQTTATEDFDIHISFL
jgi:hypothetical protein